MFVVTPKPFFKNLSKNNKAHKLYASPVNFVHSVHRVTKFILLTLRDKEGEGQILVVLKSTFSMATRPKKAKSV